MKIALLTFSGEKKKENISAYEKNISHITGSHAKPTARSLLFQIHKNVHITYP